MGEVSGAVVQDNFFHNNTDVHMVMGGCLNCRVLRNRFTHDSNPDQASFAALVLHRWHTGQSGSYVGTLVEGNSFDCGPRFLCGQALAVGADSWARGLGAFGATIRDNTIANAVVGFHIDEVLGDLEVSNLRITSYASGQLGCDGSSRELPAAAINVAPASWSRLSPAVRQQLQQAVAGFPDSALTRLDHDLCVPSPVRSTVVRGADRSVSPPSNPVNSMISAFYQSLLLRNADSGGLTYWSETYVSQGMTCSSFARALLSSAEFRSLDALRPPPAVVMALYRGLLFREPDAEGLIFWSGHLSNGLSRSQLQEAFLSSPEFRTGTCMNRFGRAP